MGGDASTRRTAFLPRPDSGLVSSTYASAAGVNAIVTCPTLSGAALAVGTGGATIENWSANAVAGLVVGTCLTDNASVLTSTCANPRLTPA